MGETLNRLIQPKFIERVFWIVLLLCLTAATFHLTNYQRDHEQYKTAVHECRMNNISLEGAIERLEAENHQLKNQPLR